MSKLSNQNKIIVGVLSLFLIVIVGYAIFSESINVGGTASASGEFNIIFNSVGTIKEEGSSGATAEISSNKKSLTVNVPKLEYPSAYVEVPVVIKNMGSVTGKIIGIETVGLDTTDIKVTYSGIGQDDRMAPNEERNMKIKVTWDSASTTIVDSLTFSISINYEQVSGSDVTVPTPEQSDLFTWDGPGIVSGLSEKGIAEVKANGGHLVIPEGVTEIAGASLDIGNNTGSFDKGFSPLAINKIALGDPDLESKLQDPTINFIKQITLPSTLIKIGTGTFGFTYLEGDLILPNGLVEIGQGAFGGSRLGNLVIPNTVTIIDDYSFQSTTLGSLRLGNLVMIIGRYAFASSSVSGNLVIPDSVKEINSAAFSGTAITSLSLGTGVETIGDYAFDSCYELSGELIIPANVRTVGESAFSISSDNKITKIVISRGTTYQNNSFYGRPALTFRD